MKVVKSIRSVLSGDVILEKITIKKIKYAILVFVLALLYLVNHFHGIYVYREISKSEKHVEELRAESVAIHSELLKKTNRRGSVLKLLEQKGSTLKESKRPPYKIEYNLKKSDNRNNK